MISLSVPEQRQETRRGIPEATLFLNLAKSIETHQEKLGLTPSGYLTLTGKTNTNTETDKASSITNLTEIIKSEISKKYKEADGDEVL